MVVGVRLQRVAGRDRKVDIKPFAIGAADVGAADTTGDGALKRTSGAYWPLAEVEGQAAKDGRRAV